MIDHLLGRPSESWKRTQAILVIIFWTWRLIKGNPNGPPVWKLKSLNRRLRRFSPWQIIIGTLTALYAIRHFDVLLGLGSPEPLAHLYSRSYYRATWIATSLDAGFVTAMMIRGPKWLKDLAAPVFGIYYLFFAEEGEEKLRKFRATCTVEMLRSTWEKTTNPYIRAVTRLHRPRVAFVRKILLPRPRGSPHTKPIAGILFFDGTAEELTRCTDLILDFPGGAFVCMNPQHHEERLRHWAKGTKRAVLALDYGKSPEYPYPWAIEEGFDAYRVLVESKGRLIGMGGEKIDIVMTGDSAGGNIATTVMFKIIESSVPIQHPVSIVLTYPALDFNFTSWMTDANLRVLRSEQSTANIPSLLESKDHMRHRSPLALVQDTAPRLRHRRSWTRSLSGKFPLWAAATGNSNAGSASAPSSPRFRQSFSRATTSQRPLNGSMTAPTLTVPLPQLTPGEHDADDEGEGDVEDEREYFPLAEHEKPLYERVLYDPAGTAQEELQAELRKEEARMTQRIKGGKKAPIGTRLTMTSRTGFFQDRIISPSMMRASAILYIGPKNSPDFASDYYLSPILAPAEILAKFPTTLIICGERDPFVDDSLIFAGRLREAKLARKREVERTHAAPSARFGEGLRMSADKGKDSRNGQQTAPEDDPILEQDEEDWVQLRIIEGTSHGFLQMTGLMHDALEIVKLMGQWIRESFENAELARSEPERGPHVPPPPSTTVPAKANGRPALQPALTEVGPPIPASESEGDLDAPLTFTTKKRRSPPASPEPRPSSEESLAASTSTPPTSAGFESPFAGQPALVSWSTSSPAPKITNREFFSPPMSLSGSNGGSNGGGVSGSASTGAGAGTGNGGAGSRRDSGTSGSEKNKFLLSEAEVLRRRRVEAVMGMGETRSGVPSDNEEA